MSLFERGRAKTGGRRKGVKDRIGTMFLEELAKDFEEHGAVTIRIARIERPVEYLKIIAATLPREFEITDSRLDAGQCPLLGAKQTSGEHSRNVRF